MDQQEPEQFSDSKAGPGQEASETVVPLYVEEASITKKRVETGRVKVTASTHSREQVIEEALNRERVEVDRKPIGKQVDTAPQTREEDGVTIIPVVEEEIVVERRLILKEELHIRKIRETDKFEDTVQLRRQEVTVTREAGRNEAEEPGKDDGTA